MPLLGMELPDNVTYLPLCVMIGGGLGWLVGVFLGSAAGSSARSCGVSGRRLLLAGTVVIVIGTIALVVMPVPSGWPGGGVTLFTLWRNGGRSFYLWRARGGGPAFEIALLVDAAMAVTTLFVVRRRDEVETCRPVGRIVGAIAVIGLVVGGLAFSYGTAGVVRLSWSATASHQKSAAVMRTEDSLTNVAGDGIDRAGSFPADLDELLAAGGNVQPGTQVEFAGVVNGSFCLEVGIDVGEKHAGEPLSFTKIYERPPRASSWTSLRSGWVRALPGPCTRGT
ncbi:MAG: hypothetical protein QOG88_1095 [Actinomycetota bacterium]|nr:hypothetical protein [Actinomycetota bacterium]